MAESTPSPRRRRWPRVVLGLLVVAVSVWCFGVLSAVGELTARARRPFAEPLPDIADHVGEQVRLRTSDREDLGAWFFPGESSLPAVVLLHGNQISRSGRIDELKFLLDARCSVLTVTVRAHGDSSGDRNDFGYSARHDVIAAVRELKQRCPNRPLLVWGGSLSAAASIFAAPELEADVSGWLLECPYRDLATAVQQRLRMRLPSVLSELAWWNLRLAAEIQLPYWREISPVTAAARFPKQVPVTIIAAGLDQRATTREAEAVAAAIGSRANLVVVPKADHMQMFPLDQQPYRDWLKSSNHE